MKLLQQFLKRIDLELFFLIVSLFALALGDPEKEHFSLCMFKWFGFHHCPGCGLGHSITWFFHGNFISAYESHFFGIPAVFIILHRIFQLVQKNFKQKNLTNFIKQS